MTIGEATRLLSVWISRWTEKLYFSLLKLQQPGHIAVEGEKKVEIYGATVACHSIFCKHSSFY